MEETDDKSFFRPKEALEDEIKKNPKIQIRNYLGNLRNEKGFKIVKNDTLALVDGDVMGNLKENTKESKLLAQLQDIRNLCGLFLQDSSFSRHAVSLLFAG
mgnify:CR=1 FL=1